MFTKEKFLKEGKNRHIRVLDKDHFFTIQEKLLELGFEYCTVIPKTDYRNAMKCFIIFCYTHNGIIHPRPDVDDSDKSTELTDAELYDIKYKYNIGDVVKYVDDSKVYPDYDLIFEHLNFEDKKHNPDKNIPVGSQVTIFNRITHPSNHQPLYAIRFKNEELLIDEKGLESIEDNSWKIAVKCDNGNHGPKIIEYLISLHTKANNAGNYGGSVKDAFYYLDSNHRIDGKANSPEGYKVINSSSLIESKHVGYIVFKYEEGEIFADVYKEDEDGDYITNSLISMIDDYIDTSRAITHKGYLSASPMNQEQIEWYKECLKQNTILDFPLKEHDKIEDGYYDFNSRNDTTKYIIKIINNSYYYILESKKMWSGPTSFTNRKWINDYDITPTSDDKVKWMDICIEKNRFVDKHELSKLLPKETVENTQILSKDYIKGKYYYSKFYNGKWNEIIFKYHPEKKKNVFIQITIKSFKYDSCCTSDSFMLLEEIRRLATEEEIKWLDACIKANKFIEQNEIPNVMTKIPIDQIITEACLQDKPNIILENYNIKSVDDVRLNDDGYFCNGKLGSKKTTGCVGLTCQNCKINGNKLTQEKVINWLFRDFQGNLQQELDDLKANDLFLEISDPFNAIKYVKFDDHMSNSKIKFIASEEIQVEIPKLTINKVNINFLTK